MLLGPNVEKRHLGDLPQIQVFHPVLIEQTIQMALGIGEMVQIGVKITLVDEML
jgi:hypothetical protein